MGRRKPAAAEPFHSLPLDATMLASPAQSAMPEVGHRVTKVGQSVPVARHSEVSDMPAHNGLQPLADFWNRVMHTPPHADFHLLQLGPHTLANRLPKHHEPSLLRLSADVRKTEEIEGLRFTQTNTLSVLCRMASELDQPRLFRVQFQLELLHSFFQFRRWAHVRRKFYDLHVAHASPVAAEAIERIGALYAIEQEIRGKPAEERCTVRQARTRPQVDQLHTWFEQQLHRLSRKSDVAAAIRYALSRWRVLLRYLDDGRIEIDNNPAERALRAVALGRKNYLFAGSDAGGERAASIYTLVGTAKLNGLDPELYLRLVLGRIANHPISRIHELLPWNLAANLTTTS